jgi:hypothetical protein
MQARELRRIAWERQDGRCAVTGRVLDWDRDDLHHRRPGGRGGTSRANQQLPANVIAVLAEAHNMGSPRLVVDGVAGRSIHTDPRWSRPLGLLVSSHVDEPGSIPVRLHGHGWVFLDDDGGMTPLA